jgi:arsenate reductase-like glutaredoxin family protein
MAEFNLDGWELREIKSAPVMESELAEMYKLTNSYEALFSKKSTQIKAREIDVKTLKEEDFKALILDHYSFLKRPVFITAKELFTGSDKSNLEKLHQFFGS